MQEPDPSASEAPAPGRDDIAPPAPGVPGPGRDGAVPRASGVRTPAAHAGRGLLMGLADLVPGVSGGTVALLLGIHPRLVAAIAAFDARLPRDLWGAARGDRVARGALRRLDLGLLLPLGLGIAVAILAGARFISHALDASPQYAMAVFFGLLLASVPVPWRHIQRRIGRTWTLAVLGFLVAASLTFLPGDGLPVNPGTLLVAGFLALTAMLLPGVSGSAFLVILGVYGAVVSAVADLDVVVLVPFAIGAVLGLMAASRALRWLYVHAWDGTLAVMTGLIAGSLVRVWPWRSEDGFAAGVPGVPGADLMALIVAGLAVAAAAAVWLLQIRMVHHHRNA